MPQQRSPRPPPVRQQRIADQILKDLSRIIALELKDPRVGMITLTEVILTADYAHAKVYFTLLNDDAKTVNETTEALHLSAAFLRHQLGRVLKIHTLPQLRFIYDNTAFHAANLSRLIRQANATRAKDDDAD